MAHKIEIYPVPMKRVLATVIEHWNNGGDFKIVGGPYCSKRDIESMKKDFDIISLKWVDNDSNVQYHTIHTDPLAGLTHYV